MSTNVLTWVEETFRSKVDDLGGTVSEEALSLLREANAEACDRLQKHPRVFLKVRPQLHYWIERHAEFSVLLAEKVSGTSTILAGHYADAVSVVTAWKPGRNGSIDGPDTKYCPRAIDLYGRLARKERVAA